MKYVFLLNEEKDEHGRHLGWLDGYQPGQKLVQAYQGEIEAEAAHDHGALERLFETFNINHPADYWQRSMSVGDVVVLDGLRAYACARIGFEPVALPAWEP